MTKKSAKSFMTFGSAKKDKEKKNKDRDSREKDIPPANYESSNISSNFPSSSMGGSIGVAAGSASNQVMTVSSNLEGVDKHGGYIFYSK